MVTYEDVSQEEKLIELFKQNDKRGKGTISKEKLVRVMQAISIGSSRQLTENDFQAVLASKWKNDKRICYAEFVHWLAQASIANEPKNEDVPQRHLVLHFDINKTCIMSDRLAGKGEESVVNEILANTSWGLCEDDGWKLITEEPSFLRPPNPAGPNEPKLVSYAEYAESVHPGRDKRKHRTKLTTSFTKEGQPGAALAWYTRELVDKLRNPDGTFRLLIPSFFHLLVSLKKAKRSFALCFRTFGEDLADVAEELNSFCEGRHPLFPGHRMDGSDGDPDFRLNLNDPRTFGTFHRTSECDSLVLGTLEQPGEGKHRDAKDRSLRFYDSFAGIRETLSGGDACRDYLWELLRVPGTAGFRDHFQFWKHCHNTSDGGKLFYYKPSRKTNQHEVFFDDNIRYEDAHIIQPVNLLNPAKRTWVISLLQRHLCKVEPLQVIHDKEYFIKELARLEDGYERHLLLLERIRRILFDLAKVHRDLKHSWMARRSRGRLSWYDCWSGFRREDCDFSHTVDDDCEGDDEIYVDATHYRADELSKAVDTFRQQESTFRRSRTSGAIHGSSRSPHADGRSRQHVSALKYSSQLDDHISTQSRSPRQKSPRNAARFATSHQ